MLLQYLFANTFFALAVFSALAFFTTGWLYLDSWTLRKKKKTPLIRAIGFFLLSIAALIQATSIDLPIALLSMQAITIVGLLLILGSLLPEPILSNPSSPMLIVGTNTPVVFFSLQPLIAMLYLLIAVTYLRKTTEGLERQLKGAGIAFLFLSFSALINISFFWNTSPIASLSQLLSEYGPIAIISHLLQLIGIIILAVWSFGYLRFRLQAQLFIIITASSLFIFLITTFLFTLLLLRNLENDALAHLKTDVNVMHYAIERVQYEALADAKAIAQDSAFQKALEDNDTTALSLITSAFMLKQQTSFLTVTSDNGEVVMRGEDREKIGDSLRGTPLITSALKSQQLSNVVALESATTPQIQIQAAVPVISPEASGSGVIGAVLTGFVLDNAFVDNIKSITGLDTTIFAGNKRAATTFIGPDGKSRFIGTLESNQAIADTVLNKGQTYVGKARVLNQPFYTVYSPLKTLNDKPIGMLFMGKLQTTLFITAQESLTLTFLGSVLLILLSMPLSYLISRYIYKNINA